MKSYNQDIIPRRWKESAAWRVSFRLEPCSGYRRFITITITIIVAMSYYCYYYYYYYYWRATVRLEPRSGYAQSPYYHYPY